MLCCFMICSINNSVWSDSLWAITDAVRAPCGVDGIPLFVKYSKALSEIVLISIKGIG